MQKHRRALWQVTYPIDNAPIGFDEENAVLATTGEGAQSQLSLRVLRQRQNRHPKVLVIPMGNRRVRPDLARQLRRAVSRLNQERTVWHFPAPSRTGAKE